MGENVLSFSRVAQCPPLLHLFWWRTQHDHHPLRSAPAWWQAANKRELDICLFLLSTFLTAASWALLLQDLANMSVVCGRPYPSHCFALGSEVTISERPFLSFPTIVQIFFLLVIHSFTSEYLMQLAIRYFKGNAEISITSLRDCEFHIHFLLLAQRTGQITASISADGQNEQNSCQSCKFTAILMKYRGMKKRHFIHLDEQKDRQYLWFLRNLPGRGFCYIRMVTCTGDQVC